jgi:hypothetical protein
MVQKPTTRRGDATTVFGQTLATVFVLVGGAITLMAQAQAPGPIPAVVPTYVAPPVVALQARTLRTYEAAEANQGVAVDRDSFYPIDNTVVARYGRSDGRFVTRWSGPSGGLIRHLNSCLADAGRLWCAHSNYPVTPMGSSVEVFETATMRHVESVSLGMTEAGSLTWFDRYGDGWIAGFAHYDGNGGLPDRGHQFSSVVTFDDRWRRTGGWLFPASVMAPMAPYAASGGAVGPDGWLYLLGHDKPELYVVARPTMGPAMIHVATVTIEAEGQAFAWSPDDSRTIFTIDRRRRLVRQIQIPVVPGPGPDAMARTFR